MEVAGGEKRVYKGLGRWQGMKGWAVGVKVFRRAGERRAQKGSRNLGESKKEYDCGLKLLKGGRRRGQSERVN